MKQYDIKVNTLPDDPRLDKVIAALKPEFSRSQARKLIEEGSVYLNRKRCKQCAKEVRLGNEIRIYISEKTNDASEQDYTLPESLIVFEDEDFIVVNKPPGIPTHATIDSSRNHLVLATQTMLAARTGKKPADIYLGVHHRLDRDTSGIILFTKRKEANPRIAQAFQERIFEKTYLAICLGVPKENSFAIKSYLGTHPRNKRFFASVQRGGKFAHTDIRLLETKFVQSKKVSLIEAKPLTGRTHQIRVHLSENHLPILGDEAYGVRFSNVPRLLLHAWRLKLDGTLWTAPMPEDFQALGFQEPKDQEPKE